MNRVVLPPIAISQLYQLTQPVDICDEQGIVLGRFVPMIDQDPMNSCPYNAEQLNKLQALPGVRALKEIWATLGEK